MSLESRFNSRFYYWKKADRLIWLFEEATPAYWNGQWLATTKGDLLQRIKRGRKTKGWFKILKKYLPDRNSRILEGGCGDGHLVDAMTHWGYKAIGVDYAAATIEKIKVVMPVLDVRYGDVRGLEFEDNFFDGYLSLGVLEHFWQGYDDILTEMYRVLKLGGYAFVTVPCISYLDRLKIKFSGYPEFQGQKMPEGFYQFGLDVHTLKKDFEQVGFTCIRMCFSRYCGLVGLARVCPSFRTVYSVLSSPKRNNLLLKVFRKAVSAALAPLCSDMVFFVMKKT